MPTPPRKSNELGLGNTDDSSQLPKPRAAIYAEFFTSHWRVYTIVDNETHGCDIKYPLEPIELDKLLLTLAEIGESLEDLHK